MQQKDFVRIPRLPLPPLVALALAALALTGCGLIEDADGPTREDFARANTVAAPEQSESAATANDMSPGTTTEIDALEPAAAADDGTPAGAAADLGRALAPGQRHDR